MKKQIVSFSRKDFNFAEKILKLWNLSMMLKNDIQILRKWFKFCIDLLVKISSTLVTLLTFTYFIEFLLLISLLSLYVAKWFDSIWVLFLENQIKVHLISLRFDVISIWFDFDFYRFEIEKEFIYRMFLYIECYYI